MSFKFDFDRGELVPAELEKEQGTSKWEGPFILVVCGVVMFVFINYIAPWLGHFFFGAFL